MRDNRHRKRNDDYRFALRLAVSFHFYLRYRCCIGSWHLNSACGRAWWLCDIADCFNSFFLVAQCRFRRNAVVNRLTTGKWQWHCFSYEWVLRNLKGSQWRVMKGSPTDCFHSHSRAYKLLLLYLLITLFDSTHHVFYVRNNKNHLFTKNDFGRSSVSWKCLQQFSKFCVCVCATARAHGWAVIEFVYCASTLLLKYKQQIKMDVRKK